MPLLTSLINHPLFHERAAHAIRLNLMGTALHGLIGGAAVEGSIIAVDFTGPLEMKRPEASNILLFTTAGAVSALANGSGEMFSRIGGINGEFHLTPPPGEEVPPDPDILAAHVEIHVTVRYADLVESK